MNSKDIKLVGYSAVFFLIFAIQVRASDFASEVISPNEPFGGGLYDDPNAALGKPTTFFKGYNSEVLACSLVCPAWNTTTDGNKVVVTIGAGAEVIVGFDHKVADDPCNPYGIDFIVFGNSQFAASGFVGSDTDMDEYFLRNPTFIQGEWVTVSVAQYSGGPWYSFSDGPYADDAFPTNAFAWDSNSWGDELDWLKPVDPNLSISAFDGLSAAEAIALYDGSAGGTGFDLQWLESGDYEALEVDPVSGRRWIQYIKVTSDESGEVDGFADVAGCGDYQHLYPVGDFNRNCKVDAEDFAVLCQYWLADINDPDDPAVIADIYEDDIVNFFDFALAANNWSTCNWECQ